MAGPRIALGLPRPFQEAEMRENLLLKLYADEPPTVVDAADEEAEPDEDEEDDDLDDDDDLDVEDDDDLDDDLDDLDEDDDDDDE